MTRISVCMCTYNGERFVALQLQSVLDQLGTADEVVICDDRSTDNTVEIIRSFNDPRVRLYVNDERLGVVANFDRCLSLTTGDLIFLSDQDDVWRPNRVQEVTRVFASNPDVSAVLTNAAMIDAAGQILMERYVPMSAQRANGTLRALRNVAKNTYLGCALVFRRTMLAYILPIPSDVPMHDMWIGIINDLYGRTFHLDLPLLDYRVHDRNTTTPMVRGRLIEVARRRWRLIKPLLQRLRDVKRGDPSLKS
jgi:glycosyltransferase involved in cell wall biosynthesis